MQSIRGISVCIAIFIGIIVVNPASARDCSVSKEFRLQKAQVIAGILEDPFGAVLSGFELQLLSGMKTVRQVTTSSQGGYDFGEVLAGKYRIHVRYGGNPFCAPKIQCGSLVCNVERRVTLNPKNAVLVK
jgi:hypothetical protein